MLLIFNTEEEKEKISVIFRDYADFMMRTARRILKNDQDAEDVVQEAFLYIADNLDKINTSDRQKTMSYLAITTEHKAIDLIRKRHADVSFEEYESTLMSATTWTEDETLSAALLALPQEYRELLLLRFLYGYSTREIANLLHRSYAASAQMIHRAKQRLAQILSEQE